MPTVNLILFDRTVSRIRSGDYPDHDGDVTFHGDDDVRAAIQQHNPDLDLPVYDCGASCWSMIRQLEDAIGPQFDIQVAHIRRRLL